jgi:hypothetical protein
VDFERVDASLEAGKFGLGFPPGAVRQNSAIVFRSETIAEGLGFALFKNSGNDDENNKKDGDRNNDDLGTRELTEHCVLLCGVSATAKGEWGGSPGGKEPAPLDHGRPGA